MSDHKTRLSLAQLRPALPALAVVCALLALWLGWSGWQQWQDANRSRDLQQSRDLAAQGTRHALQLQTQRMHDRLASPAVQAAGVDRLRVDFGLEIDRSRRFALWSLLYILGQAPDLDVAFKEEADREAARSLMDLLAASDDG